jgi:hypothetical protein
MRCPCGRPAAAAAVATMVRLVSRGGEERHGEGEWLRVLARTLVGETILDSPSLICLATSAFCSRKKS